MEFFDNHNKLFGGATILFIALTLVVAISPALKNIKNNAPLPSKESLSDDAFEGKKIYIANGCVACHTQQVRNIDMDRIWGDRPSIAADYADISRTNFWTNTATLMGTERTGPDLTNIGNRQPSLEWNLLHLYQPRAVVKNSVMPAYPWLFEVKDSIGEYDVEVAVPDEFRKGIDGKIIAKDEALKLVKYIQSLKQPSLPDGRVSNEFLYNKKESTIKSDKTLNIPDGGLLYAKYCQACHQPNGEGLKGAFPSLKGSPIVLGEDIELIVQIIMQGYDARSEFAVMNAVGMENNLSSKEVTAIINHERTSWGNNASKINEEEVKKIMNFLSLEANTDSYEK